MDTAEQPIEYTRNGTQPSHFVMMPNMAINDLTPNAYKLLAVYLDMTSTGQIYAKNSTVAGRLGMSSNTMKKARKELADKGYIICAPGKDGKNTKTANIAIQIDWMWRENHNRMSNSENRVSNSDTPPVDRVSNSDTNKQYLNIKDITITQEKEKDLSPPDKSGDDVVIDFDKLISEIEITFKAFGSEAKLIATLLMGTSTRKGWAEHKLDKDAILNHAELIALRRWYQMVYSDRDMVKQPMKINSIVFEWRNTQDYQAYLRQRNIVMQQDENQQDDAAPQPAPASLERPLDWQPKTPEDFAWIDAQPDYPIEPDEAQAMITAFEDLVKSKTSKKLVGKTPPGLGESA